MYDDKSDIELNTHEDNGTVVAKETVPIQDGFLSEYPTPAELIREEAYERGMTPLHVAAVRGNVPLLKLFLARHDAKPVDEVDQNNKTAFQYAVDNENYACAYVLLEKGARATPAEINTLMAWAIGLKLFSNAGTLLEKHNADVNTKSKSGLTLLEAAVIEGAVKLVDKILTSNTLSVELRAKALELAKQGYEKAKLCKQEGFWSPQYTAKDKENLRIIIESLQGSTQQTEPPESATLKKA